MRQEASLVRLYPSQVTEPDHPRLTIFLNTWAKDIDDATRSAVSRVSNIIRVLSAHFVPLTDTILLNAYEWAVEQDGSIKDLLQEDIGEALVAAISAQL